MCVKKAELFPKPPKNRRLTPKELETEFELCRWMKRPPRYYTQDPPFYPWVVPEPIVNFDLKFKE